MGSIGLLSAAIAIGLSAQACVGSDPTGPSDPATETPDGDSPGADGSTQPTGDGSTQPTDGGADAADAAVLCGYPGEACCAAPFLPCNTGTACTSGVCAVTDVWAIGDYVDIGTFQHVGVSAHYNGSVWTAGPSLGTNTIPTAVWGLGTDNVRAVTTKGKIELYSGSPTPRWLVCGDFGCSDPMTTQSLWGIYGFSGDDFWVGGTNVMYQCGGTTCTSKVNGLPATWGQGTFTGTSSNDLWYPQFDKAFHYNGVLWTVYPSIQARSMWAHSKTDVWAGDSTLQHFDGAVWSAAYTIDGLPAPGPIFAMSGTASDDVWVAGYKNNTDGSNVPFTARWNGTAWKIVPVPAPAKQIQTIWAASKKEAYIGSFDGGVFRWDGTAWTAMTVPGPTGVNPSWSAISGSARPRP